MQSHVEKYLCEQVIQGFKPKSSKSSFCSSHHFSGGFVAMQVRGKKMVKKRILCFHRLFTICKPA